MNTKRIREYQKEIDRLKKLDWNTSIKINQEFKDRKEAELKNFRLDQDKLLSNCCGAKVDNSEVICLQCYEGCEPIQEETEINNFDNRLKNFINNLK